jgi:RES domain-containing protein
MEALLRYGEARAAFFFQGGVRREGPPDDRSPIQFFYELRKLLGELGRVRTYQPGLALYRARPRGKGERHTAPGSLGPPPAELALQANRMNPPGIPMFYGADRESLAIAEVGNGRVSLARFETTRAVRIVDLVDLPPVPGYFSQDSRERLQDLAFLHKFAREVSLPVPRDERVHVDYLPTQVFTEFLRDVRFAGEPVDGIRYPSATSTKGANIVLFATQEDVEDAFDPDPWVDVDRTWLRLTKVTQKRGANVA